MAAVRVDKMANEREKAKMATAQSHSHTLPVIRGEHTPSIGSCHVENSSFLPHGDGFYGRIALYDETNDPQANEN